MQIWSAWLGLARLGWDMQAVMALRMMRMAGGGARAQSEAGRMVTEKMAALVEAQAAAATEAMKGGSSRQAANRVLRVYKRRVRRNRRRLTR